MQNLQTLVYLFGLFSLRQLTSFINITLNVPDVKSAIKSNKT